MSDEELSRKIALHLGWKQSLEGRWIDPRLRLESNIANAPFEPPNMVADPAMTVMLLGRLIDGGWRITFNGDNARFEIIALEFYEGDFNGRAVAEAFAKANNL